MSYINIIELTAFLFSEGWNSTRGPVLETVPVLVNQKSFQNTETIKTILLETYFELAAWADFQSRIYKATSRKRQYVYNRHRKAPPKHRGWGCWRAVQPPSYSTDTTPPRLTSIVRGKMGGQMESNGVYSTGGGTRRASAHTPQTRSCFIGVGVCFWMQSAGLVIWTHT